MKTTKKILSVISVLLVICLTAGMLTACSSGTDSGSNGSNTAVTGKITVVSREDGSGTRGAFTEIFHVMDEDKNDLTVTSAEITNSTGVMMSTIAGNQSAIGYISLGALNDTVKALKIDGAEATVENVKSGSYKISRSFNIITGDNISEAAQDFIDFIMSAEGQAIIEDNDYISAGNTGAFGGGNVSGGIKVTGSSSVAPIIEKLAEAYQAVNSNVKIDVLQSDSTTGIQDTIDGNNDFGMASRELKDAESGVKATEIAIDGIAVIVNNNNSLDNLTSEQMKNIYTGELVNWSEIS